MPASTLLRFHPPRNISSGWGSFLRSFCLLSNDLQGVTFASAFTFTSLFSPRPLDFGVSRFLVGVLLLLLVR